MMDGKEKSDSGIVAAKPTNKAGQPAAELVEPRPETKGSAEQQRMHRTQSRDRMFQSLDRVRKAARLRKKGSVHRALPPYQRRYTSDGFLRAEAQGRSRGGWHDVAGLRGRPRAPA